MDKKSSKHLRIAGVIVILLGVLSILAIRGILSSNSVFAGISEETAKETLFGLTGLYAIYIFQIIAGLFALLMAGRKSIITVICGVLLFVMQLWPFVKSGNDMTQIIINIVLLAIPYYYLHNAYKVYKSK